MSEFFQRPSAPNLNFNLVSRMRSHASHLTQFYMPLGALVSKLVKGGTNLCLPTYMLVAQVIFRLTMLVSVTTCMALAITSVFVHHSACLLSRTAFNTSYQCLNVFDREAAVTYETYKGTILVASILGALLTAPVCHMVSSKLFNAMVQYLSQFEQQK